MSKLLGFLLLCVVATNAYPREKEEYDTHNHINDYESYIKPMTTEEMEADVMVSSVPFQMPFQLNRYQKVAIVKLAKQFLKPILMSSALKTYAAKLEEVMVAIRDDPELVTYIKNVVDDAQHILENTNEEAIEQFLTWLVAYYTDEYTARSINSFWSDLNPAIKSWVMKPLQDYFNFYIRPSFKIVRRNLEELMGEDIAANTVARSGGHTTWSNYVEPYLQRMTEMAVGMREMVEATSTFLKLQEESRSLKTN